MSDEPFPDPAQPPVASPDAAGAVAGPAPEIRRALARLPKIDAVLARDDVRSLQVPRFALVQAVRELVTAMRQRILAGAVPVEIAPAGATTHGAERARAGQPPHTPSASARFVTGASTVG